MRLHVVQTEYNRPHVALVVSVSRCLGVTESEAESVAKYFGGIENIFPLFDRLILCENIFKTLVFQPVLKQALVSTIFM